MRDNGDPSMAAGEAEIEAALRERVRDGEARHARARDARPVDSLWDHLLRVARIAEQLARAEGVDPADARLAGLFHDAGKFAGGRYHDDDRPEEHHSVVALRELAAAHRIAGDRVGRIADAILSLYRDDPDPSALGRVLFDADNLDKLGPLGVANHFVKAGLRGGGVSDVLLRRSTVELTYARCAPRSLWTATGRAWATRRAPQTERFHRDLLDALREDGIADLRVDEHDLDGLTLVIVESPRCGCGGRWRRSIDQVEGLKCHQIRLVHRCRTCGRSTETRFCRPRLIGEE